VAESKGKYQVDTDALHTESDIWQQIAVLEEKMFESAKNLEFEEAANLRDEVTHLKRMVDGVV
jgi:excinuclease ABC subunit B